METYNGMHRGDLEVTGDLSLTGTVTGDLIVLNGWVIVRGVVSGSIRVLGGVADIHGRVGAVVGDLEAVRVAVGGSVAGKVLGSDLRWHQPTGPTVVRGDAETYPMSELDRP